MMPAYMQNNGQVFKSNLYRTGNAQPTPAPSQGTPYGRVMDGAGSGFTFPGAQRGYASNGGSGMPTSFGVNGSSGGYGNLEKMPWVGGPQGDYGDVNFAGGSPNFDERTGRFIKPPANGGQPLPEYMQSNQAIILRPNEARPEKPVKYTADRPWGQATFDPQQTRNAPRQQGYEFPRYDNPVYDPIVAQNEYDRLDREQKNSNLPPKKSQRELDREAWQQESRRTQAGRNASQQSFPGLDQAAQKAIAQRISIYGDTPEQAYQNVVGFRAQLAASNPTTDRPIGEQFWRGSAPQQPPQPKPAGNWNEAEKPAPQYAADSYKGSGDPFDGMKAFDGANQQRIKDIAKAQRDWYLKGNLRTDLDPTKYAWERALDEEKKIQSALADRSYKLPTVRLGKKNSEVNQTRYDLLGDSDGIGRTQFSQSLLKNFNGGDPWENYLTAMDSRYGATASPGQAQPIQPPSQGTPYAPNRATPAPRQY